MEANSPIREMDLATIQRIQQKVRYVACKYGRSQDADDIAQEIIARMLEGRHQHSTVDQAVIDYLRAESANQRLLSNPNGSGRKCFKDFEKGAFEDSVGHDSRGAIEDRMAIDRILEHLGGRQKEIAKMYFLEGLSYSEIGIRLGISGSRVWQLVEVMFRNDGNLNRGSGVKVSLKLSKAENEVADLVRGGMSNKEVAEKLFVTEKTVKFHLSSIYKKLNLTGRSQLIAKYHVGNRTEEGGDMSAECEDEVNYVPVGVSRLPAPGKQPARQITLAERERQVSAENQENVLFVVNTFGINKTIDHLQMMSEKVTEGNFTVDTVLASCQCIGRMNETINTVIKASQSLRNGR